jgi:hypothetical protein
MKVPRQCPLVLLVKVAVEELRRSVVKKVYMKGEAGREVDQGSTALSRSSFK